MFKLTEAEIVGTTNKLLFNIWQEMKAQNESATAEQIRPDLAGLSRAELMALVKALPVKPAYFNRLSNAELIKLLGK